MNDKLYNIHQHIGEINNIFRTYAALFAAFRVLYQHHIVVTRANVQALDDIFNGASTFVNARIPHPTAKAFFTANKRLAHHYSIGIIIQQSR